VLELPSVYTGKQKIVDTGGRVDKFRKKYAR
jgi:ribosomal protein L31